MTFLGRLISLLGDVLWPLRSPDLLFFFLAILKENFSENGPMIYRKLKRNIIEEIDMITSVLESVRQNIVQRMRICSNYYEKHLKNILFKN